jgi:hypothetical protein
MLRVQKGVWDAVADRPVWTCWSVRGGVVLFLFALSNDTSLKNWETGDEKGGGKWHDGLCMQN